MILPPFALFTTTPLDVGSLLSAIERRYNRSSSFQMRFEQQYRGGGQPSRTESGMLFLKKPGRMRWEYRHPEGKLFVTDGKYAWFYSPAMNQVEKSPLRTSDDLRAPLAFLMGRLNFQRDFQDFRLVDDRIQAKPRSAKSPYREVEFSAGPSGELRQVTVYGQDGGQMTFRFSDERLGGVMREELFHFVLPTGAEFVIRE